jgi:hypothetical protein
VTDRAIHFVGFRGDEYARAIRVFGTPDFVHPGWDLRAAREIADGDLVLFATGSHDQPPSKRSFDDLPGSLENRERRGLLKQSDYPVDFV